MASDVFMAGKSWPAALAAVEGALTHKPLEAEYHHHRANILAILGRINDAERAHREAIRLDPHQPDWWWKLSEDLRNAGRMETASQTVREALSIFPEHPSLKAQAKQLLQTPAVAAAQAGDPVGVPP
jgi:predicted Zn-dependent protease